MSATPNIKTYRIRIQPINIEISDRSFSVHFNTVGQHILRVCKLDLDRIKFDGGYLYRLDRVDKIKYGHAWLCHVGYF